MSDLNAQFFSTYQAHFGLFNCVPRRNLSLFSCFEKSKRRKDCKKKSRGDELIKCFTLNKHIYFLCTYKCVEFVATKVNL